VPLRRAEKVNREFQYRGKRVSASKQ